MKKYPCHRLFATRLLRLEFPRDPTFPRVRLYGGYFYCPLISPISFLREINSGSPSLELTSVTGRFRNTYPGLRRRFKAPVASDASISQHNAIVGTKCIPLARPIPRLGSLSVSRAILSPRTRSNTRIAIM
jgi:hypothetical protein